MRDVETIDGELALAAEVRLALLADGCDASAWQVDGLLDERLRVIRRALVGRVHFTLPARLQDGDS
ncbi:hypothetical protein [Mycolicibacterium sp. 050158]|uniref:hypothetical protein n=1 Tax=Mycolicibacterium sp. 050158 TaxID=3090602 RepID=UPI00299DC41C|nr:hypothetical protein [Mycolicibacterium sp. 050158]MDX1891289.1 hypothetical protein [Mycolicibacterium sp. 050158]